MSVEPILNAQCVLTIIFINELSQGYLWVIMTENTLNNLK